MVFIDEASMATEPLTIIPLMKGVSHLLISWAIVDLQSSHVAIIGDHKQLPPVIISPIAHAGGLATSLFERLIHEKRKLINTS
jgi:superfamily I DNA and/or RNA helicase